MSTTRSPCCASGCGIPGNSHLEGNRKRYKRFRDRSYSVTPTSSSNMTVTTDVDFLEVPPLPPRYRFRDLILGEGINVFDNSDRRPMRERSYRNRRQHRNSGVVGLSDSLDNIPPPPKVHVEFFTNEKSFKERLQLYFIKNQRSSLRIRIFNLAFKLLTCVLYVVRVLMDKGCICSPRYSECRNDTERLVVDPEEFRTNPNIDWEHIFFVCRPPGIWECQVTVAVISLTETLLVQYLGYKGNILQQILSLEFILEVCNTVPFIITIFVPPLRQLFIPVFFNCWLAKSALQNMLNDLHRVMQRSQSALAQQLMILSATLLCLAFTSTCGIQHLQRGGNSQFGLFESFWFIIVTFATVGYGEIYPDIWPSQLFMIIMICAALIFVPTQVEQLVFTWLERQKQGGTYSSHRAQTEKHVVVCATTLNSEIVMDFLNEFYAHPKLQNYYVVLLSPCELEQGMKMLLQAPLWAQRVIYIRGSALKDNDLARCRIQDALACFMLAVRTYSDKGAADQHTILRSWAVKDYAPHCPLYVQIFRPENKFHVKFAEHVVCEDEFRYALLANNCLCPGTSTFVTLLLHTSRGQEGQASGEEWQRLYGRGSGNEIYHICLGESKFFGEYEGKSFTFASFHAHRKYGVSLLGIQKNYPGSTIQLNPGPRHIMQKSDVCFYMNISKEENSAFILAHPNQEDPKLERTRSRKGLSHISSNTTTAPPLTPQPPSKMASMIAGVGSVAMELHHSKRRKKRRKSSTVDRQGSGKGMNLELPEGFNLDALKKRPSIAPVPAVLEAVELELNNLDSDEEDSGEDIASLLYGMEDLSWVGDLVRGFPPVTPYIGTSPTLCHLVKEKRDLCCLQLAHACDHCTYKHAKEYAWPNRAIIITADYASTGLYNFIVPLRSHARPRNTLNPIVLMLEQLPDKAFLDTICYFPMIYWMIGSIDCLDDLLCAGINLADNVVVVNKETSNSAEEETLADCNTIVAVQTIFRLFPSANIITELSQSSNMRFMQFRAKDIYSYTISKLEKKERERGSHMSYMFRLPFAAGSVFSASMLDTLLYQAFVKDYMIIFVRLLLGIDQAVGSGHLSCMRITKDDLWIRTYGRLYQKLCSTSCEIPIGIYRTQILSCDSTSASLSIPNDSEEQMNHISNSQLSPERQEMTQMVKCRMISLGLPLDDYDSMSAKRHTLAYVIINPSYDLKLEFNDIVYLIRPSSLSAHPSPLIDERRLQKQQTRMAKREEPPGSDNSALIGDNHNPMHLSMTDFSHQMDRSNGGTGIHSKRVGSSEVIVNDGNSRIPIIYTHSDEEEEDNNDDENNDDELNTSIDPLQPAFTLDCQEDTIVSYGDPDLGLAGTVV